MGIRAFRRRIGRGGVGALIERLEGRRLLTTYTMVDLGTLGGGMSRGNDLNDAGEVVGMATDSAGRERAFVWRGGVMTDLGTLGGAKSQASGINGFGEVVGFSAVDGASGSSVAFRWGDGVMGDLGLGSPSNATAINDAGQVVGTVNGRAFLWDDGVTTDLGGLGGVGASAADINVAGQVAGSAHTGEVDFLGMPVSHAFLWEDGVMKDLRRPAGSLGTYAHAVNNYGQVVGSMTVFLNTGYGSAMVSKSFFYDGSEMKPLPVPTVSNHAADINDSGQIVGTMNGGPYIYEDGVVKNLNSLVPPASGVMLAGATAINNAGQILAYSTGTGHAYLLTPDAPVAGTEVQLWVDGNEVNDESGLVDFGSTVQGAAVTRTFTVRNVGSEVLTLSGPITLPAGFVLVSGFGAASLAPGATTTFVVRMTATALGNFAGQVSFGTNDSDEGQFNFNLSGAVPARVIDDGTVEFTSLGFGVLSAQGYQNDVRRAAGGTGSSFATWTFAGLSPGNYRVSATWTAALDRATNAPFTISSGAAVLGSVAVNQERLPDDFSAHGVTWEELGTFAISGNANALTVRLTNGGADGFVIADAIRVEPVAAVYHTEMAAPSPVPVTPLNTVSPVAMARKPVRKAMPRRAVFMLDN